MKNNLDVEYKWISPKEIKWDNYGEIFKESFSNQFKDFSLQDLSPKASTRKALFADWFKVEVSYETAKINQMSFNPQFQFYFLEARIKDSPVAYAIWHLDSLQSEPLYLSSLAILSKYQGRNLGRQIVHAIRKKVPEAQNFVLNTRASALNRAHLFFQALNCTKIEVIPDESLEEPSKFTGYLCPMLPGEKE